jgi:multidrug efflux pump subunit AcrB
MDKLTKGVLNRPVAVIVSLLALILFGLLSITNITLKLMPDISIPMMVITETYAGASPEEVDEQVIDKIRDAVSSIQGMKQTTTQSNENYGMVMIQFNYGTDMDQAYDDVKQAVDGIKGDLPDDAGTPTIMEIDTSAMDDMQLSVTSDDQTSNLLNVVNDTVEPALRRCDALAQVTVSGGDDNYIRVQLIPEYASQYGISTQSVVSAIQAVNYSMPAGSVDYGDQYLNMESEVRYNDIDKLKQVPVTTAKGQTIHLSDVANVSYATKDKTELSRYNGNDSITIALKKKQSDSAVTLSREVKAQIKSLEADNPGLHFEIVNDSADEINKMVNSVFKTLVEGVLLSMAVIFIFFGDFKGSMIVGSTMPISLLAAIVCMRFAGISLNIVSMNALVLSIGMITDNAVVVIEMCFRRQSENGETFREAAYQGTKIVMNSIIGSTVTTVVVYIPLALMNGMAGQMFGQLGYTIVFVLTASLLSAILLVPFFFMVYKPVERKNNPVTKALGKVADWYGGVLSKVLKKKKLATAIAVAVFAATMLLATTLRTELITATDEGVINVAVSFRPNLNLDTMDKTMQQLEQYVSSDKDVDKYTLTLAQSSASGTLTAYKSDDYKGTTQSIIDKWNTDLQGFADNAEITVSAGSSMGTSTLTSTNTLEKDLVADSMDELQAAAEKVRSTMEAQDGVLSVSSSLDGGGAKADVNINPVMASAKGFAAQQLSGLIYANMSGTDAAEVTVDKEKYKVHVEYPDDYYKSLDDVSSMTFTNVKGESVPLTDMADVELESAPTTITRKDARYYATVTATMTEGTRDAISDVLNPKIAALDLGSGAELTDNTATTMMNDEFKSIGQAIIIAFYLVFMVMAIQFESIVYSILIMLCIPFALIGSVLLLKITNIKLSMSGLMGVLMLAGIVVNNGIIYVDTANQFRAQGEEIAHALVHAGKDRLRPILITTLTTELSMLPVAMGLAKDSESMQGMAVVIVGGLFASTILTLLLLPTFYMIVEKLRRHPKFMTADDMRQKRAARRRGFGFMSRRSSTGRRDAAPDGAASLLITSRDNAEELLPAGEEKKSDASGKDNTESKIDIIDLDDLTKEDSDNKDQ